MNTEKHIQAKPGEAAPAIEVFVSGMRCYNMSRNGQLGDVFNGQESLRCRGAFANMTVLLIGALVACVILALATPSLTAAQIISCLVLAGIPTGLPILAYARGILAQEMENKR